MTENEETEIQAILRELRRLRDLEQIRGVLARYSRAFDRLDIELAKTCYHADAIDHHGAFYGLGTEFVELPKHRSEHWRYGHHQLGQSSIDLDGDTAYVETYCIWHYQRYEPERDQERFGRIICRYIDRFERRDEEWRIAFRRVALDGSHSDVVGEGWPQAANFVPGRRAPDDEVYHPERLRKGV
ncbi:nuclear transport factor 2 family protein [soil metagenome]